MKNILIHGLGQNGQSWAGTAVRLEEKGVAAVCPGLFEMAAGGAAGYAALYQKFSAFCMGQGENLNLCGLSLGGVLALDFAKEHPEKVNSIVLIGVPYQIPKVLFRLQNALFHLAPSPVFEKMGVSKKDFIALVRSMGSLKPAQGLDRLACKALIVCGAKDRANQKSAGLLHKAIQGSQLKIVQNAAHEVNVDAPEELAGLLHGFWAGV